MKQKPTGNRILLEKGEGNYAGEGLGDHMNSSNSSNQ